MNQRVERMLDRMTLEEKVDLATGELNFFFGFYNNPIERLGIPALQMADGPAGIRIANPAVNEGRATQLPAPLGLAATFDEAQARRYGAIMGREARATAHNVVLGPSVDIARSPQGARNFEALGEDPLLAGRLATEIVQNIQSRKVLATLKHYLLNVNESNRFTIDAIADNRTLHEIYNRPWEMAVQKGKVASAMCAFNRVNGTPACQNRTLLIDILKEELGFRGFVMSDYGATGVSGQSAAEALLASANGGLDMEQPGGVYWGPNLVAAVERGEVSIETLNDKVRRILRPMFGLGLFDYEPSVGQLPERRHGAQARDIARRGIVLLKNEGDVLPLADDADSIAVIGADANNTGAAGGGSSLVNPTYTVSPLQGIRQRAGQGVDVEWAPGTDPVSAAALIPGFDPVPSSVLSPPGAPDGRGLLSRYWSNAEMQGDPALDRVEPMANVSGGFYSFGGFNAQSPNLPLWPQSVVGARFSAVWTGTFTAPATGEYTFSTTSAGSNEVHFDGEVLIDNPGEAEGPTDFTTRTATVSLQEGQTYDLRIEYRADAVKQNVFTVGGQFRFGWQPPEGAVAPSITEAAQLAANTDVAIVVARDYNGEGFEDKPDLRLPNNQAELIRQVAAANPNTIVVLTTGNPVETRSWEGDVPAILEAWYGGQEQGNAIADVLFGDHNPSGRLPMTFPTSENETPIAGNPEQFPGANGVIRFLEGVFVGYRGHDEFDIEPQYPFGHGLSYTTFDHVRMQARALNPRARVTRVRVLVRNTGGTAGTEVVQVYAGELPTEVDTPERQLIGFGTVRLRPGQQQWVSVNVERNSVSYYDGDAGTWVTPRGLVPLHVGSSSRDEQLAGNLQVR